MDKPEAKGRVLVIEDERHMRAALQKCLEAEGYRVLTAADGESGLRATLRDKPDLVLLDIMMPRLDGFALCSELRRRANSVPVLMLTAKAQVEDRVKGLDAGADDYLLKPFSTEELLARVRALLRRVQSRTRSARELTLGETRVDFVHQQAWRAGKTLHLTSKEFAILRLLADSAREPVSRERFLDVVWGYGAFPTTRTVDTHIAMLRVKIEPNPAQPSFIQTVHSAGYRLEIPAATSPNEPGKAFASNQPW
jgi:DNA-binding response OmpR family regulator